MNINSFQWLVQTTGNETLVLGEIGDLGKTAKTKLRQYSVFNIIVYYRIKCGVQYECAKIKMNKQAIPAKLPDFNAAVIRSFIYVPYKIKWNVQRIAIETIAILHS